MKKKIYIYGLIITFFISTTALPLTQRICRMMEMTVAESCEMQEMATNNMMSGCCEKDKAKVTISGYVPVCCEIEVSENKLSDQFIFVNNEKNKNTYFTLILINTNILLDSDPSNHSKHNLHNTSPPHFNNDLYIQNSVLLI